VEGDSVVAEALGDSSLDWTSGGQFLHLTFLVEKYLLVRLPPFGASLALLAFF
jgi:hypothetical protein